MIARLHIHSRYMSTANLTNLLGTSPIIINDDSKQPLHQFSHNNCIMIWSRTLITFKASNMDVISLNGRTNVHLGDWVHVLSILSDSHSTRTDENLCCYPYLGHPAGSWSTPGYAGFRCAPGTSHATPWFKYRLMSRNFHSSISREMGRV